VNRSEYQALTANAELRSLIGEAANTEPPSRSQIVARLEELGVAEDYHGSVVTIMAGLARERAAGLKPFHARQVADQLTLGLVRKLAADDDLLGRDPIPTGPDRFDVDPETSDLGSAIVNKKEGLEITFDDGTVGVL
jgi:hypothetical protein